MAWFSNLTFYLFFPANLTSYLIFKPNLTSFLMGIGTLNQVLFWYDIDSKKFIICKGNKVQFYNQRHTKIKLGWAGASQVFFWYDNNTDLRPVLVWHGTYIISIICWTKLIVQYVLQRLSIGSILKLRLKSLGEPWQPNQRPAYIIVYGSFHRKLGQRLLQERNWVGHESTVT